MQDYRFSLTAANLMVTEFVGLATLLSEKGFDYDQLSPDEVQKDRFATREREFRELILRLKTLSQSEVNLMLNSNLDVQKFISFIACARLYRILSEFIIEVVWEKILVFDNYLDSRDMGSFIYNKTIDHPEIAKLSESTRKKVQQVIFKMLEQADLIDNVKSKKIQIPYLDVQLLNTLSDLDRKYLLNI